MKVLVTGAKGQLGYDVCKRLEGLGIDNKGVDINDFDLTKREDVLSAIKIFHPDCVVHCAAYTAVDKAESNRDVCFAVNVEGTRNIALGCKAIDAKMIYISTDYVFNGQGEQLFEVDDPKAPLNVYGESKLAGEQTVQDILRKFFIIRTSWVFGINGHNFVKAILRLAKEKDEISVVCDQIGSPTYTPDLAVLLCDMLQTEKYGVFHATNEGYCSWFEFAQQILSLAGSSCKLKPIETKDYLSAALRPKNSRLSKSSLTNAGFELLPTWNMALEQYCALFLEK